ncbi:hypothetical protein WME73_18545 [Sorangium sp. So ce302]|uniref:hypothetical protein n=1 Tax=Sorangium sp. So ce302 TaxID=3133297 RepID=UPI003F638D29
MTPGKIAAVVTPLLLLGAVQAKMWMTYTTQATPAVSVPADTATAEDAGEREVIRAPIAGTLYAPKLTLGAQVSATDLLFRVGPDHEGEVTAKGDAEVVEVLAVPGTHVAQGDVVMALRSQKPMATSSPDASITAEPTLPGTWSSDLLASGEYVPDLSYAGYCFGEAPLPRTDDHPATLIDVTRFDALPDDDRDDTTGLRAALDEAERHKGPVVVRLPPGRFILSDILFIERGDITLQGSGSGANGTTIYVPKPLAEMPKPDVISKIEKDIARRNWRTGHGGLYSAFAWNGGIIWTRNPDRSTSPPIGKALEGKRGQHDLRMNDANAVTPGEILSIRWYNRSGDDSPILRHMFGVRDRSFGEKMASPSNTPIATQEATVVDVKENVVVLKQPLLFDVHPEWGSTVSHTSFLENIGIEHLRVSFKPAPQAPHEEERGFNAIYLTDVAHSWVRDVRVDDPDSAFLVTDSANVTLEEITVSGRPGHYGVILLNAYNVLVKDFDIDAEEIHSISFDSRAHGNVYTHGRVRRGTLELHRGPSHANLFDDIVDIEDRDRAFLFSQTGQPYWGPAGGYNIYWNLQLKMSTPPLAPLDLGPLPEAGLTRVVGVSANVPVQLKGPAAHIEHIGADDPAIDSLYRHQLARRLGQPSRTVRVFNELQRMSGETRWTVWGNGHVARNGKYYFAMGNHQIVDGNTMVMEYDPDKQTQAKVFDVASAIEQRHGQKGHGKIHADIVEDADGWLYFATWWGGRDPDHEEPAYDASYQGSILLRYHPELKRLENLGTIVREHGVVTAVCDRARGLIYFRAISYRRGKNEAGLAVFDIAKKKVVFTGGGAEMGERRGLMLGGDGMVYFSGTDLRLHAYDPAENRIKTTDIAPPSVPFQTSFSRKNMLRVGTPPAPSGTVYATTHGGMIFSLGPSGQTRSLGTTWKQGYYAPSLAFSPDERWLYYAPYLPGPAGQPELKEAPVMRFDLLSGQREVLALLGPRLIRERGYIIGQNYGVALDARRSLLYLLYNGRVAASDAEVPCFVVLPLARR